MNETSRHNEDLLMAECNNLNQDFYVELEGTVKEAFEQSYTYENEMIDKDRNMSTNEKIQAHRQSFGIYLAGELGTSFFSYFIKIMVNSFNAH